MRSPRSRGLLISQSGWQELKETLARAIATSSSSPRNIRKLHARVVTSGLRHNLHLCSLLIGRYSSFRDLAAAIAVFYSLDPPPRKALLWNSLMRSCIQNNRPDLALRVYNEMTTGLSPCAPDAITFNLAIKASIDAEDFQFGSHLAECVRIRGIESHPLVSSSLLVMYSRSGDIRSAREVFEKMPVRDLVSWNAMISSYSLGRSLPDAINLFKAMKIDSAIAPSQSTLATLVSLCGRTDSLEHGQIFHGQAIRLGFNFDISFSNALMKMYICCNSLNSAYLLFEKMSLRDPISWSTIIGGYLYNNRPHDSIKLFHWMISSTKFFPTRPILLNFLRACTDVGDWRLGKQVEVDFLGNRVEIDAHLATSLIFMYAKCGRIDMAFELINENMMVKRDKIAWNALIKGCVEAGNLYKAVEFLAEMQRRGIAPDWITLLTLISISSLVPLPNMGMTVHAHVLKRGFSRERPISNSLIDMYSECGNTEYACKIFDGITDKDVIAWSSMMKAYSQNGLIEKVLDLFGLMKESGMRPNHFTCVSVLSACSHGGYVDKAWQLFKSMEEDYGLEPCLEHYACIIDLLGRAGYVFEAFHLIQQGFNDASNSCLLWRILLNACSLCGNWVIGEAAGKHLFHLEPQNAANYIILANIYMSVGRREDANIILRVMRKVGLEKDLGFSQLVAG